MNEQQLQLNGEEQCYWRCHGVMAKVIAITKNNELRKTDYWRTQEKPQKMPEEDWKNKVSIIY